VYLDLDAGSLEEMRAVYGELRAAAMAWIREEHGYDGSVTLIHSADMRYRGQSYEIDTPLEAAWIDDGDLDAMAGAFHAAHERIYEHADADAPVQVINMRLVVVGTPPKPTFAPVETSDAAPVPVASVPVYYDGATHTAAVYARGDLYAGQAFPGPAIVTQDDCTTCVLGGFTAQVDPSGNLILSREG
jgi:N-methylhydantoinase A